MTDKKQAEHQRTESLSPEPAQQGKPAARRYWQRGLLMLLLSLVLAAALCFAAVWTQNGTRALFSLAHTLTQGRLSVQDINGSLGTAFSLQKLQWQSQDLQLEIQGLEADWNSWSLLSSRFELSRLHAASVAVATLATPGSVVLPTSLRLPLTLRLQDIAVGKFALADLDAQGKQHPVQSFSGLRGRASYEDGRYQADLQATSAFGQIKAKASMLATAPFALEAQAAVSTLAQDQLPALQISSTVKGHLSALDLSWQAGSADTATKMAAKPVQTTSAFARLQGSGSALITLFAPQLIARAHADLVHLDPSAWNAAAPKADLRILADIRPISASTAQRSASQAGSANDDSFALQMTVQNTAVASLDQHGLPLQSLQAEAVWSGHSLQLQRMSARLAGDGQITGAGQLRWDHPWFADGKFVLSNINLQKLHQSLRAGQIRGEVHAKTNQGQQILADASLQDQGAKLQLQASYDIAKQLLTLPTLTLQAGASQAEVKADISFAGKQLFQTEVQIHDFDPGYWITGPAGKISAHLKANGQLQPATADLKLEKLAGHYAGQVLDGSMQVQWLGKDKLKIPQADLQWGKNRLHASGAWGEKTDQLNIGLDAPELQALNPLWKMAALELSGSLKADGQLRGGLSHAAGQLELQATQLELKRDNKRYALKTLQANLQASDALAGVLSADIRASGFKGDFPDLPGAATPLAQDADKIQQLSLRLNGKRAAHTLRLELDLPDKRQFVVALSGGIPDSAVAVGTGATALSWSGQLTETELRGTPAIRLLNPVSLELSADSFKTGRMQLQSPFMNLQVEQLEWVAGTLKTKGQMQDMRVVELINLFAPQDAITGNLRAQADWDVQLNQSARAMLKLRRQSGDLRFNDPDGTGVPIALGIRDIQLALGTGNSVGLSTGLGAGLSAAAGAGMKTTVAGMPGETLNLHLQADGTRLGQWQADVSSALAFVNGQWRLPLDTPVSGKAKANVPDLEWLGPWLNPGLVMKGRLNADALLGGTLAHPDYHAHITGAGLELAFASEGLLLPNGVLDAQIDGTHLRLNQLQFSNTVTMLPQHAQFKGMDVMGKRGEFSASGEIDIGKETGAIQARWQQFPMLQRKDRWLLVSGEASIVEAQNIWTLQGQLMADGAYFKLPKLPPPSLSSDVNVSRKSDRTAMKAQESTRKSLKTRVDVSFEMGPKFVFVGRGLDTGLAGKLRMRSNDGSPLQATGSISTVKGLYEGYGQQLAIERGILNFQGPPANPGLNILALRQGLQNQVGVEVIGTVVSPQVRLFSDTAMSDAEKLSWLVLGRGSDQLASGDASLLMSAASAIFGGDGSRNVPRDIVQGLGFDEFSIGASGNSGSSHVPGQTIAGSTTGGNTTNSADQVVSVGKRLMPGLVLSVERGLGDASGAIKLSWQLTRRITVTGRTGSESAIDVNYTFSFN
ncbi:translocation/assembly module TamB domain-containing protein [Undibacterium sp. CY7W]|uniref:Translocation/assembly module TamB domain-containing protein n=1 Tax=Undibacterium rugosum TaxID=2762291 RepID=A0A923KUS7_9BURK|nr:translocation/assembly module TamB domain-containing protein [Undibacterium rugosum]MBC3934552.1 translocation/assembly module TamB domain-containing protein [Undibacterium rugosum]